MMDDRGRAAAAAYSNPLVSPIAETATVSAVYPVIVPDTHSASIMGLGDDCGLEDKFSKRLISCLSDPSHDHYAVGGTSCGRPECPRHCATWARRAADRVGCRIAGWKAASKGRHNPRHTVLSLADEDPIVLSRSGNSDKSNIQFFRKLFIKRAFEWGGIGGSIVIHLWRPNDDVPDRVTGERKWDFIRSRGYLWKNFVKFSPHAHIIGYGFYDQPKDGDFWYKNFPHLEDRDSIESVAYYQLSHAPVGVGNAVVYWGCCRPGHLNVAKRPWDGKKLKGNEHVPVYCKKCGAIMVYDDSKEMYERVRSWAEYVIGDAVWSPKTV